VTGGSSPSVKSAEASTFIELTLPDLLARTTSVVVATPLESNALWEESPRGAGRRIVTYTHVKVLRVLDGAPLQETWIRTLGGRVGDVGQHVEGDAVLVTDHPAVLFLKALPDGPHAVVGMSQGQYPLEVSAAGAPPKLVLPLSAGKVLPDPAVAEPRIASARGVLRGKTVDEAAALIADARRSHAP